jgi:hypothetical protein
VLGEARVQGQALARVLEEAQERRDARRRLRARAVVGPAWRLAGAAEVVGLQRLLAARACIAAVRRGRPVEHLLGLAGVYPATALASLAGVVGVRARFYFSELDPAWSAPASSVTLLRRQAVPSAQPDRRLAKVRDQRAR